MPSNTRPPARACSTFPRCVPSQGDDRRDESFGKPVQRVFVARNVSEAHIVSGMLNAAGIGAQVRGHYLAGGYGELPITSDTLPSVWIDDDRQLPAARMVIDEYERPGPNRAAGWRCEQCSEIHPGQFTACWKCGRERRA
jgi:hypothetical protein